MGKVLAFDCVSFKERRVIYVLFDASQSTIHVDFYSQVSCSSNQGIFLMVLGIASASYAVEQVSIFEV